MDISAMPGNCGMWVFHDHLGSGLAEAIQKGMYDMYDTSYALYTLTDRQKAQAKILRKAGFRPLDTFVNENTSRTITIYGRPRRRK